MMTRITFTLFTLPMGVAGAKPASLKQASIGTSRSSLVPSQQTTLTFASWAWQTVSNSCSNVIEENRLLG